MAWRQFLSSYALPVLIAALLVWLRRYTTASHSHPARASGLSALLLFDVLFVLAGLSLVLVVILVYKYNGGPKNAREAGELALLFAVALAPIAVGCADAKSHWESWKRCRIEGKAGAPMSRSDSSPGPG